MLEPLTNIIRDQAMSSNMMHKNRTSNSGEAK
jgi:hypothetical protein